MNLTVTSLSKSFGSLQILSDLSFTLSSGDALTVTGPSGCGKSTLLHILGTLDRPTSGAVEMDGQNPFDLPDDDLARFRNRSIGFVFQEAHLLPQHSVLENVLLPVHAFEKVTESQRTRAKDLIDRVGLSCRTSHRPGELSGGERQRVAIARALFYKPGLLLCDEPTGSLDPNTADTISDLLFELHGSHDSILVTVTHSERLAGRFSRRLDLGGVE